MKATGLFYFLRFQTKSVLLSYVYCLQKDLINNDGTICAIQKPFIKNYLANYGSLIEIHSAEYLKRPFVHNRVDLNLDLSPMFCITKQSRIICYKLKHF